MQLNENILIKRQQEYQEFSQIMNTVARCQDAKQVNEMLEAAVKVVPFVPPNSKTSSTQTLLLTLLQNLKDAAMHFEDEAQRAFSELEQLRNQHNLLQEEYDIYKNYVEKMLEEINMDRNEGISKDGNGTRDDQLSHHPSTHAKSTSDNNTNDELSGWFSSTMGVDNSPAETENSSTFEYSNPIRDSILLSSPNLNLSTEDAMRIYKVTNRGVFEGGTNNIVI